MSLSSMASSQESTMGDFQPYRTISKLAGLSLALGIFSVLGFLFPALIFLPALGFLFGVLGLRSIRRYPRELTGKIPAIAGLVLSGGGFLGAALTHSVIYATEVPAGYTRISFQDLQPLKERPDLPISPQALELDGQQVFVKGYVYPDGQQRGIKRFVLVRDMGTCCFGGQPKLSHMIEVTLQDPLRTYYAVKKRKLAGVLHVDTSIKPVNDLGGVFFQLKADYLR